MYQLDPHVAAAFHEYRRQELQRLARNSRISRQRPERQRPHLHWPPWPIVRVARKRDVAAEGV